MSDRRGRRAQSGERKALDCGAAGEEPAGIETEFAGPPHHRPAHSVTNRGFEKRRERGEYVTVATITSGRDAAFVHPSDGFLDLVIARRGGVLPTMGLLLRYVGRPCGISDERDSELYDYVKARSVVLTPEPGGEGPGGGGEGPTPRLSGSNCLNVDGEVLPGIPTSILRGGAWEGQRIVSKSGAFGDAGVLARILG